MSAGWICRMAQATDSTATIWCKSPADGLMTARCGGVEFSGSTIDQNVRDGAGVVTLTGLSPGHEYSVEVFVAGTRKDRLTIRTGPRITDVWHLLWMSCSVPTVDPLIFRNITRARAFGFKDWNPRAVVMQGDFPYSEYGGDEWDPAGIWPTVSNASTSVPASFDADNWHAMHDQYQRIPSFNDMFRRVPSYFMRDDHESGDNWDGSIANANVYLTRAADLDDVLEIWQLSHAAVEATQLGNPGNADALAVAEVPPTHATAASAADYPVGYFRQTMGAAELFQLDNTSYRSPEAATDNASKTMLGANQKAWLKAALAASRATFKVISTTKKLYRSINDNSDVWSAYTTERAELETYISANGITGVIFLAGDRHSPDVSDRNGLYCINACPLSVDVLDQGAGYNTGIVWKVGGYSGVTSERFRCFGVLEVRGNESIQPFIISMSGKRLYTGGKILSGSNAPSYAQARVA